MLQNLLLTHFHPLVFCWDFTASGGGPVHCPHLHVELHPCPPEGHGRAPAAAWTESPGPAGHGQPAATTSRARVILRDQSSSHPHQKPRISSWDPVHHPGCGSFSRVIVGIRLWQQCLLTSRNAGLRPGEGAAEEVSVPVWRRQRISSRRHGWRYRWPLLEDHQLLSAHPHVTSSLKTSRNIHTNHILAACWWWRLGSWSRPGYLSLTSATPGVKHLWQMLIGLGSFCSTCLVNGGNSWRLASVGFVHVGGSQMWTHQLQMFLHYLGHHANLRVGEHTWWRSHMWLLWKRHSHV